ncbi:hypothetical protein MYVALT_G_01640 [Candidatus Vallotia tarda]|uniref:Uncharacterized protein n=1 Tax=Candidatus Vallotiella hemipterorum TaxID=1177213 RepID=A0A916JTM9_9BURK|nr:hypothetical protein MYVALT_G_01640 [Candidatus Vallotia tarda]
MHSIADSVLGGDLAYCSEFPHSYGEAYCLSAFKMYRILHSNIYFKRKALH